MWNSSISIYFQCRHAFSSNGQPTIEDKSGERDEFGKGWGDDALSSIDIGQFAALYCGSNPTNPPPTGEPTIPPTGEPTGEPTIPPTGEPTGTPPTDEPTGTPTVLPTVEPTTPPTEECPRMP